MGKIILDDSFYIESDNYNYTLVKNENKGINKDTGKDIITNDRYYYANIKDCLKCYVNKSIVDCNSIEEVIKKLEELETIIEKKNKKKLLWNIH